ncbi:hypothetical protein [Chitinophaga polysaccharea]|uniref:hypothetical protein n=1 Tax=Chitinophaga polysaccharea TaxID=1293035 RepID=UPI0011593EDA|nr:hypothetical protein [Chitinophaga polysaccharea]
MKKKISVKQFDYDYFKKMEINNSNRILGGIGTQINNCTYSSDTNTANSDRGSNQNGSADDAGGTADETTTVPGPPAILP